MKRYYRFQRSWVRWLLRLSEAFCSSGSGQALPEANAVRALLLVRLDHLGDLVMSTRLLSPLKARYPGAQIYFLCHARYAAWLRMLPQVTGVITVAVEDKGWRGLRALWGLPRLWRAAVPLRFDLGLDPKGHWLAGLILWGLRVPARVGFSDGGGRCFYTAVIDPDRDLEPFERQRRLLQILGADPGLLPRVGWLSDGLISAPAVAAQSLPRNTLFFPGASEENKRWPWTSWMALAHALTRYKITLVAGPAERQIAREWHALGVDVRVCADACELWELMRAATLIISNDAGPAHLAAALDIPSLTIFGAQDPVRWHPYPPDRHPVVYASVFCRPCGLRRCYQKGHEYLQCLTQVKVETVLNRIAQL